MYIFYVSRYITAEKFLVVLQILDKQLEILVLLALHVPCITAHRHTTIVINETVVNPSVGP